VTEVYAGMRPRGAKATEALLRSLKFYESGPGRSPGRLPSRDREGAVLAVAALELLQFGLAWMTRETAIPTSARHAGELKNEWAKKGHSLALPSVTITAVALAHGLTLVTGNRKHFPVPELQFLPLP
jgi:hypothetical protein